MGTHKLSFPLSLSGVIYYSNEDFLPPLLQRHLFGHKFCQVKARLTSLGLLFSLGLNCGQHYHITSDRLLWQMSRFQRIGVKVSWAGCQFDWSVKLVLHMLREERVWKAIKAWLLPGLAAGPAGRPPSLTPRLPDKWGVMGA